MDEDKMETERQIVRTLNEKVETMDRTLDRHEKYFMIIHCVKENEKENTDKVIIEIFERETQEKASVNDIDRPYRLGKKHMGSRPRLIIIKFVRYNAQNAVFRKENLVK